MGTKLFLYSRQKLSRALFKDTAQKAAFFDQLEVLKSPQKLLSRLREEQQKNYVLIVTPYLHDELRLLIRQIRQIKPQQAICLCSLRELAYDAWRLECFDFLALPVKREELALSFQKFRREILRVKAPPLTFRYQGGEHVLHPEDILYCKGAGNYTHIQLRNGSKLLLTLKIGEMDKRLEKYETLRRVGRSFIINTANILAIRKLEVLFKSEPRQHISISKGYLRKLKGVLLNAEPSIQKTHTS